MRKFWIFGSIIIVCFIVYYSCNNLRREITVDNQKLLGKDYRLFQKTPAWDLAKAVWDNNTEEIEKIGKENKALLDFQEPRFGKTVLMLAVYNNQFESVFALLKSGANPNIHEKSDGSTALLDACDNHGNTDIAKLLLEFGAKPNEVSNGKGKPDSSIADFPLMAASREGNLEIVKLLIHKGAEINKSNDSKEYALTEALIQQELNVILYLLENGADYNIVVHDTTPFIDKGEKGRKIYIAEEIRYFMYALDSYEYSLKMKIVDFLKQKGIDYRKTPIPESVEKKAKELYPNSYRNYLAKY
jgi:uncharacterized protein